MSNPCFINRFFFFCKIILISAQDRTQTLSRKEIRQGIWNGIKTMNLKKQLIQNWTDLFHIVFFFFLSYWNTILPKLGPLQVKALSIVNVSMGKGFCLEEQLSRNICSRCWKTISIWQQLIHWLKLIVGCWCLWIIYVSNARKNLD